MGKQTERENVGWLSRRQSVASAVVVGCLTQSTCGWSGSTPSVASAFADFHATRRRMSLPYKHNAAATALRMVHNATVSSSSPANPLIYPSLESASPPAPRTGRRLPNDPRGTRKPRNKNSRNPVSAQTPRNTKGKSPTTQALTEHIAKPSDVSSRPNTFPKDPTNVSAVTARSTSTNPTRKKPSVHLPWKAGYHTSLKTQRRLQQAVQDASHRPGLTRATVALRTLLQSAPERCNAANVVCALTLSAKAMTEQTNDTFRTLFYDVTAVLSQLLKDDALSTRQLCNVAWAIAKHCDRDATLLPNFAHPSALSSDTVVGRAETWDLAKASLEDPDSQLDQLVDDLALMLAKKLSLSVSVAANVATPDEFSTAASTSGSSALLAKPGELSMASWAYGVLRQRKRPPGWKVGPQMGRVQSSRKSLAEPSDGFNFVKFEQWNSKMLVDECVDLDPPSATDILFDAISVALCAKDGAAIQDCKWSELANIAWAFASHGRSCSGPSADLLMLIANESSWRLNSNDKSARALSRDLAQIIWSLGILQADNFRLADGLTNVVAAVQSSQKLNHDDDYSPNSDGPMRDWSCTDIVQVALSLAHARLEELPLLRAAYAEALHRLESTTSIRSRTIRAHFQSWELGILLWAQARLHLKASEGQVFECFASAAVDELVAAMDDAGSLANIGIGSQEQANIAWALTVLQEDQSPNAIRLLSTIFADAAAACEKDGIIQLEHAHQLWQAYFLLQESSPPVVANVSHWFRDYLRDKWSLEKSRTKLSSARHRSLSQALDLMGIAHKNEHDEDIDVAIVLKKSAVWTHQTKRDGTEGVKLAVEFDGPNHFTRQRKPSNGSKPDVPRALGHTVLKYRLLKKQGWTVVRVPYYEFDKIPYWASMERQRYLQRLLKTHANLRFSQVDVSEYKAPVPNRETRFD
jgi:hypothetical protein